MARRVLRLASSTAGVATAALMFAPWWSVAGGSRSAIGLLRSASVLDLLDRTETALVGAAVVALASLAAAMVLFAVADSGRYLLATAFTAATLVTGAVAWLHAQLPGNPQWGAFAAIATAGAAVVLAGSLLALSPPTAT